MHKTILILFTSLLFFTSSSYAEDNSLKTLQAQVAAAHNQQIAALQKENKELKKRLASYENEIAGWRLALENLEAEIAAIEEE